MPFHGLQYSKICNNMQWCEKNMYLICINTHKICNKYAVRVLLYAKNMRHKTCHCPDFNMQNVQNICNICNICTKYAQNMNKLCKKYSQNMHEICISVRNVCPSWQRHRTGCLQSPVRTLPLLLVAFVSVVPLWCDLVCCSLPNLRLFLAYFEYLSSFHFADVSPSSQLWY